jgi:hypothetical protein
VAVLGLLASSVALAQISPGDLARPHARLEGLENCTKCHSSGDAVSDDKCLSCHTALRARIRKGSGYHAKVRGRACESCHPDHRGRGAAMITWPGGGPRRFDHAKSAGYVLRGEHAEAECRDCHKAQLVRGEMGGASRGRTYLGMPGSCVGCHEDPHEPTLGSSCQSCHDESGWGGAKRGFDHSKARFPLRGAHARVDCARCHPGATEERPATFRGVAFAQCAGCHQDPHLAKMGPPASCTSCHNEQRWQAVRYDLARHAPQTFPLAGAHVRTACTACHGAKLTASLRPQCGTCHRDAHRPSLGAVCNQCHNTEAWSGRGAVGARAPPMFHDRTAFPLQGRHTAVACPECHSPRVPAARRFRPIAHDRCLVCHADPHRGELAARSDRGACESCHDVEGFVPARFETEEHAASRFLLDGAHRAVPCAGCHAPPPAAPGFRREDRSCEGCHEDPHGGQFTGRASAQSGCIGCHATAGWAPSRFGKPEHAQTGFALVERHDAPCGRCHAPNGASAVAAFAGTSRECGACHADAHAGQFGTPGSPTSEARRGGTACSTCHAGARFSPTVGFDHARTRFPLRDRHRRQRCPDCHRAVDMPGAPRTVVYRLGARPSCEGCHESPHGDPEARGRAGALARATGDCGSCHGEAGWLSVTLARAARFDHARTDAPLVGAHEAVACQHCHVGTRRVAAMHECRSCHEDRHAGRLTDPCVTCHTPRTWAPDRTLDEHRRTRFPLVGAHAAQACRTCHRRAAQGDFRDARPGCENCHLDTVRERAPHPPHVGVAFLTRCDRCHGAGEWRPAHLDHGRFWPLTGRHDALVCARCHEVGRFSGTPRECVACHEGDQADAAVDHGTFDDDDCAGCHSTNGWTPAEFPAHGAFFPVRGPHDRTCSRCHTDASSFELFTCLGSGCHTQGEMNAAHGRGDCLVRNGVRRCYEWTADAFATSALCYFCHPRGSGD